NVYAHRLMGKSALQAAIDGTIEVVPSVFSSIATTIFAFVPMFFVTGVMGKFFAVMPLAVIAILLISLFESIFILSCHLAHSHDAESDRESSVPTLLQRARRWRRDNSSVILRATLGPLLIALALLWDFFSYPFRVIGHGVSWVSQHFEHGLDRFINDVYAPFVRNCLKYPAIVSALAISFLLLSAAIVKSGKVPFKIFPDLDASIIEGVVIFPDGTPKRITDDATLRIEQALMRVNERLKPENDGRDLVELRFRVVGQVRSGSPGGAEQRTEGGHAGTVKVALAPTEARSIRSQRIVEEWRKEVGAIPGSETLRYGTVAMGPGGKKIEFKLLAAPERMADLEAAVEECKVQLATYTGVFDIDDDSRPGKWELQLQVRERARALGVPLEDVARTVRNSYYGDEVMRLQRGRHEVKLMVRYPQEERKSLADFDQLRVASADGIKRPITELAQVNVARSYSEINRVDQKRSITITADVNDTNPNADATKVVDDMRTNFVPKLLAEYPGLSVRWEGQAEQSQESMGSLFIGLAISLLATFVLLTLQFKSYVQPLIIMAVIPFGMVGAVIGHLVLGLPLTLFSVLGLVALTGIVVNDSIVLIDFINHRIDEGMSLSQAVAESGVRRFRPVMLTSLTTIAGLFPIIMEKSFQAQLLIPMATSICFG
ncbi:MAG: efflux RND transporter permease subunit, partial [Planctomycetaceae bacterium]|nr:efflux RND transporter permease subunit [Planctomycetaceae bacterium]